MPPRQTDHEDGLKRCKACGQLKSLSEFDFEPRVRDKCTARCSVCIRQYQREWAADHPETVQASREKHRQVHAESDRASRRAAAARTAENRKDERRIAAEARRAARIAGLLLVPVKREPRYIHGDDRLCSSCRKRKPAADFGLQPSYHDGVRPCCRECEARRARDWRTKMGASARLEVHRRNGLKYHYNLSVEEFEALVASQDDRCAVCREAFTNEIRSRGVDHCHATNKIRGILCVKCNSGLGQFRDNEEYLMAATNYLRKHRANGS